MTDARGRRAKSLLLTGDLVGAALVFLAWTQTWVSVTLPDLPAIAADGSTAAPALTALALAQAALVGALAIAGVVIRLGLGVVQVLLGVTVVWQSVVAIADPATAAGPAIAKATGVTGGALSHGAQVALAGWPWLAVAGGVLLALLGLGVIVTARAWPGSARKYSAVRVASSDGQRSSVDDWDALSRGDDPSAPPE
ncbi:Trp biosynthesis-associated membrane protein [Galbitalea sp. SE-J8]|uniref:Trp biosynthesis-associated membrane protein n=1 Tax=Galbitalea sp. SE-J8 TaxID=3054952 RepID=UPI00259D1CC8|nr:Trp biosynthesis-associated membrane protein [Galbitalea sp. SE-J8]MDM4764046.1 Trp biosynthesis-associated membrane protein [Galbitalea sp. SE-J8]